MSDDWPAGLLDALRRLEEVRRPLTDHATLPDFLDRLAGEVRQLVGAERVTVAVRADCFAPPCPLVTASGRTMAGEGAATRYAIAWGGEQLGVLEVVGPVGLTERPAVPPLLLRVAGETIAEARAVEGLIRATAEETQRRLAVELHDAAKQVLPAIRLLAERAGHEVASDPDQAAALLHAIGEAAQQGLEELGFLIGGLRGQAAAVDLDHGLRRLLADLAAAAPTLRVEARLVPGPLSPAVAACLVSVARNALTNVVQHAHAQTVRLDLAGGGGLVILTIEDDGIGLVGHQSSNAG